MAWRDWRVVRWLDSLDERFVPDKWKAQHFTQAQLKWVRRLMVVGGVVWLFFAIASVADERWPAAVVETVVGTWFILGRGRYAAFLVRQTERGSGRRKGK